MIVASTPPAIVMRQIDSTLDRRGGVIEIPSADGVSAQLVYPASDMPAGEQVHIEAVGPIGVKLLGVEPFGGNRNYSPYYQIKIVLRGPPGGIVHLYGAPKLILNVANLMSTTHYALQITIGNSYNIQMGATGDESAPQFDLADVPSIFKDRVITTQLRGPTLIVARISTIQLATTIEGRVENALGKLEVYRRSRSLDDLQTAIYAMQSSLDIDLLTADTFTLQRRTFVSGWAQVLRAIESAYDPKFDPDKRLPCPLPRFYNGFLPLGCDPKLIHEPKNDSVRNKEMEDLDRYRVGYEYYSKVKRLDDMAMSTLDSSLRLLRRIAPNGTSEDSSALDTTLRSAGLTDTRRQKIDSWFYARQRPCLDVGLWICKP
jgi:hypothetical protein